MKKENNFKGFVIKLSITFLFIFMFLLMFGFLFPQTEQEISIGDIIIEQEVSDFSFDFLDLIIVQNDGQLVSFDKSKDFIGFYVLFFDQVDINHNFIIVINGVPNSVISFPNYDNLSLFLIVNEGKMYLLDDTQVLSLQFAMEGDISTRTVDISIYKGVI
ncbi:MAG: hypothetical protein M0R46_17860 [Candidatus Muirbacterium halophilum]|nr:hypothetical protein [Candidatus Muirbacterium halophilum]